MLFNKMHRRSIEVSLLVVLLVCVVGGEARAGERGIELRLGAIARRLLQEEVTVTPQQYYPPPGAMSCYKITEAEMTSGKLCTSQMLFSNVTKVICQEFKPECVMSVVEGRLLVPKGDARSNPEEFQQSSEAACKLLRYKTSGSGSIHVTGDTAAAKTTCWNGREWATDNWWVQLVCCV